MCALALLTNLPHIAFCIFLLMLHTYRTYSAISRAIFTKISRSTINFKTENGSRLITEYYAFTIRVDQVNFLREKFGVSAYSRDRLVAE